MAVARTIVCVECGGTAHLMHELPPDDPAEPGDIVIYRCADCWERLDLVVSADDVDEASPPD